MDVTLVSVGDHWCLAHMGLAIIYVSRGVVFNYLTLADGGWVGEKILANSFAKTRKFFFFDPSSAANHQQQGWIFLAEVKYPLRSRSQDVLYVSSFPWSSISLVVGLGSVSDSDPDMVICFLLFLSAELFTLYLLVFVL